MKVRIKSKKAKPFKNNDGDQMDYFWYKAIRIEDDMLIEFGSTDGGHETDAELDLEIVKTERADGKTGYKELAS